jgi:hypothetical protein
MDNTIATSMNDNITHRQYKARSMIDNIKHRQYKAGSMNDNIKHRQYNNYNVPYMSRNRMVEMFLDDMVLRMSRHKWIMLKYLILEKHAYD